MGITNLLLSLDSSISHKIKLTGSRHYKIPMDEVFNTRSSKEVNNAESSSANPTLSMLTLLQNMRKNNDVEATCSNMGTDLDDIDGDEDFQRHLRIGVDISTWIAAACHGNGAELLDERHFSRHGRHEMAQHAISNATSDAESGAKSITIVTTNYNAQETLSDREEAQAQNFIKVATASVMRKIKSIQYLLSPQILVVLDGASPPIKKKVVDDRQKSRSQAALQRDAQANETSPRNVRQRKGLFIDTNSNLSADQREDNANVRKISYAKKAGAHTSKMYAAVVSSVVRTLREHEVPFLVSPYEADGQLTYLSRQKYIDFIVSEDSDFIPCGADAILYKYRVDTPFGADFDGEKNCREAYRNATANATLILREDLGASTSTSFSLLGFTDIMVTIMCVAAGCDYAPSLKGIGLVHARNSVEEAFSKPIPDGSKYNPQVTKLDKVWKGLFARCHGSLNQEEMTNYQDNFVKALVMFRHPVVFDPVNATCIFANLNSPDQILMEYKPYAAIVNDIKLLQNIVGGMLDRKMAIYVAEGWINPKICDLRYDEQETPKHIVHYLRRWKDMKTQKLFQIECDRINATQSLQETDALPSLTPNSARKSSQNPSQSTTGTSSASKPSTQGSHRSNLSADVMSPDLLL